MNPLTAMAAVPYGTLALVAPRAPRAAARLMDALGPTAPRLDVLVGDLALLVATAATAWCVTLTTCAAVCRLCGLPFPRLLIRLSPAPWRRVVLAVAGSSLVLAGPAAAVTGSPGSPGEPARPQGAQVPGSVLHGLALPDRPAGLGSAAPSAAPPPARAPTTTPAPAAPRAATDQATYRVRTGDSLWRIAARTYDDAAVPPTTAELDREWRRWYAANRSRIGPDPDALRVGTVLRPPAPRPATSDRRTQQGDLR
ncbi:LysM peptidoglycan-binding domain-containing protein [Mumia zhuanghuii]|uniref:LysM domain-containing protein n=1 Tax=Mumia zhuanghuii TaxID=2585211 RepID=A0A5C4M9G2_9ACTN|nr:LysM peptidoglycan-binding domain-containing protein [Mumia zhuanghuii]TNC31242.1 hypothetical protein FHE65_31680 [Mumia zhuanghuii]TNC44897.1 hypothetical protein FHE65_15820 [Mumia zhuanghuii]